MKAFKSTHNKGFTLIEMIIVMVILGIVASIAAPLVLNAARSAALEYDFANTISQGQNASTQMAHALRNLKSFSTLSTTAISFTDNDNTSISYSLSGSNLMRNSNILAQNTSSLNFTYYDSNLNTTATPANVRYINYTFTINNNNQQHTFTNTIYLRNS